MWSGTRPNRLDQGAHYHDLSRMALPHMAAYMQKETLGSTGFVPSASLTQPISGFLSLASL